MRKRVSFGIAVLLILVASKIIDQVVGWLGLIDQLRSSGLTLFTMVQPFAAGIEKRLARRAGMGPAGPAAPEDIDDSWPRLLLAGALVYLGAFWVIAIVVGTLATWWQADIPAFEAMNSSALIFGTAAIGAILGFWMGSRCGGKGLIALVGAVLLGTVLAQLSNFLPGLTDDAEAVGMTLDQLRDPARLLSELSLFVVIAIGVGIPAVLLGRRRRYAAYLYSLLRKLPEARQHQLADQMYAWVSGPAAATATPVAAESKAAAPGPDHTGSRPADPPENSFNPF